MIRGKIIAIAFLAGMLSCSNNDSPRVPLTNQNLESTNRPVNPSKRLVAECALPRFSPTKLSQTCFFKLVLPLEKETSIYSNFFKYEPQYQAYSDGADKKRWIYFPPGQQMITKDLDNWIFSKGTVIFKEFLVGGKKIETRILEKLSDDIGSNAWRFSNYVWTKEQDDADLVTNEFYNQSTETRAKYSASEVEQLFKISLPKTCIACHSGATDVVNGFNYLQLSSDKIEFNIFQAGDLGLLSHTPKEFDSIKGSDLDRKSIGYVQVNCAICHSPTGPGDGDFRHSYLSTSLEDEVFLRTARTAGLIDRGQPDTSYLLKMFESGRMPRIKPVTQDKSGIALIREWISNL